MRARGRVARRQQALRLEEELPRLGQLAQHQRAVERRVEAAHDLERQRRDPCGERRGLLEVAGELAPRTVAQLGESVLAEILQQHPTALAVGREHPRHRHARAGEDRGAAGEADTRRAVVRRIEREDRRRAVRGGQSLVAAGRDVTGEGMDLADVEPGAGEPLAKLDAVVFSALRLHV